MSKLQIHVPCNVTPILGPWIRIFAGACCGSFLATFQRKSGWRGEMVQDRSGRSDIWYGHKQMILKQECSAPLWTYPVISWYISEVKEAKESEASHKLRERIKKTPKTKSPVMLSWARWRWWTVSITCICYFFSFLLFQDICSLADLSFSSAAEGLCFLHSIQHAESPSK